MRLPEVQLQAMKDSFANFARENYRMRKPTPDEMYKDDVDGKSVPNTEGMEGYRKDVPLLKDRHPKVLETLTKYYGKLLDYYQEYADKPAIKRVMGQGVIGLFSTSLPQKSSVLTLQMRKELDSYSIEDERFSSLAFSKNVYALAGRQYEKANPSISVICKEQMISFA